MSPQCVPIALTGPCLSKLPDRSACLLLQTTHKCAKDFTLLVSKAGWEGGRQAERQGIFISLAADAIFPNAWPAPPAFIMVYTRLEAGKRSTSCVFVFHHYVGYSQSLCLCINSESVFQIHKTNPLGNGLTRMIYTEIK